MLGVGITGDLIGRKKVLVMGAFGMAIAATINALAPNALIFGAGRVVMGITTAMSFAMCLAFVPALYTREELPKAFSIWLAIQSAAVVVAMLAGGAIFDIAGWRGTYLVTAGLSAIFGVLAVMYVPENKAQSARKFDTLGVLLAATGLISLVYSLGQAATRGWSSPVVLGGTALALVVLTTFAVYESRLKDPGFPVTLFKIPAFAAACIVGVLFNFANASLIGQAPALLKAAGMPATSGLVISLLSGLLGVGCFFGAVISGWAQSKFKFSPRTMFVSGILVLAAGLLSQYLITVDNRIVIIAVGMITGMLVYGARHSFSVFFPEILDEFGWSRGSTALMMSINVFIYGLMAPVAGTLGGRWKPKIMMPAGVILAPARGFLVLSPALACAFTIRPPKMSPICCASCPSRFLVMVPPL